MEYSIVIPVFNKAALTRACLEALPESVVDAGVGEVIVIDNASTDETWEMLQEFPGVRTVHNETNTGFARANNQGARLAHGEFLVLLNNDTIPHPGWLRAMLKAAREPNVGAVGARLLFPDGTLQHGGVVTGINRVTPISFMPYHFMYQANGNGIAARRRADFQIVTGACLLTPRELYLALGGLDEGFWNGFEDVDYCLRLGTHGLRVVYEPDALVTHFESQSGAHRFRQAWVNTLRLAQRWNGRVEIDQARHFLACGLARRETRKSNGYHVMGTVPTPSATILVHGETAELDHDAMSRLLKAGQVNVERFVMLSPGREIQQTNAELERRGGRYVVLLDAGAKLQPAWLDALVEAVEATYDVGAAAAMPEWPIGPDIVAIDAGSRCTLLSVAKFPKHHRLENFPTFDGAVGDYLRRALAFGLVVRGVERAIGDIPVVEQDARYQERYGANVGAEEARSQEAIEHALLDAARAPRAPHLVSIVTLSWNAVQFTKLAIESIRAHTNVPYEIIVVDNGSDDETLSWLRMQSDLRVVYNSTNRGFSVGNNQGISIARGEYIVILNNDVLVPDGWLEGLLQPFLRIGALGMTAPRSNRVAGEQLLPNCEYQSMEEFYPFAQRRRETFRGSGWISDRAIGLCLCVDRRVFDEIGGFDERFGVGNFEDDDLSLRVRAAGYKIFICDDVLIHHFGSQTFAANKIDYATTMTDNWKRFAEKWGLPSVYPENGYDASLAISAGFDPQVHFAPLPVDVRVGPAQGRAEAEIVFLAVIENDADWGEIGAFVRRFVRAYTVDSPVVLSIGVGNKVDANEIAGRAERIAAREGVSLDAIAEILVSDADDIAAWVMQSQARRRFRINGDGVVALGSVPVLGGRSPSELRALLSLEKDRA